MLMLNKTLADKVLQILLIKIEICCFSLFCVLMTIFHAGKGMGRKRLVMQELVA